VDDRFDLTKEPHEPFRFGWVVEIDPHDPDSTPAKHTMLGRLKHEGANVAVAPGGRVAVYMGDDERGDYIYKFVSRDKMNTARTAAARRENMRLLRHGTLFVARFAGDGLEDQRYDGTGRWIPLASDTESFVEGMSVADVLIDTRLAADKVGATRMDRPEDIEPNPVNGKVYCALTNNSRRGTSFPVDEANPLAESMVRDQIGAPLTPASGNRNGYVLELTEDGDVPTARRFTWDLMLVCGDPEAPETYFAGYPKEQVSPISCPDNVAFDPEGNLWISTDGNALGSNDGVFRVPVRGPERGAGRRAERAHRRGRLVHPLRRRRRHPPRDRPDRQGAAAAVPAGGPGGADRDADGRSGHGGRIRAQLRAPSCSWMTPLSPSHQGYSDGEEPG
jgi:secreted PhoX family phosphatase